MANYIFLDTWVLSKLSDANFSHKLSNFTTRKKYTVLVTSNLMAELYNPKWEEAGESDRGLNTARFLSKHPCVIVNPEKVFANEYSYFPNPLPSLPIELDLENMSPEERIDSFLGLLRRQQSFLDQGKDIEKWHNGINELKKDWLFKVKEIIDKGKKDGYLEEDKFHSIRSTSKSNLELFLLSLDLRLVNIYDATDFSEKLKIAAQSRVLPKMLGARTTSLCFYYAYINVDTANRIKNKGSDIVDLFHFGLLPYSKAFTVDRDMKKVLRKVEKDIDLGHCSIISPNTPL